MSQIFGAVVTVLGACGRASRAPPPRSTARCGWSLCGGRLLRSWPGTASGPCLLLLLHYCQDLPQRQDGTGLLTVDPKTRDMWECTSAACLGRKWGFSEQIPSVMVLKPSDLHPLSPAGHNNLTRAMDLKLNTFSGWRHSETLDWTRSGVPSDPFQVYVSGVRLRGR